jgi:hypothetical protein
MSLVSSPAAFAAAFPECIGEPYEDGSGTQYLSLIGQPILIYGGDRPALTRALDSGVLVVTRVRSITTIAHEAAGELGIRRSPRPLWAEDKCTASDAPRREGEVVCETIATSLRAKRSNPSFFPPRHGLLRCAPNDGGDTPHTPPSSSANAGDPVLRGIRNEIARPQRTGYPACAGYDSFVRGGTVAVIARSKADEATTMGQKILR